MIEAFSEAGLGHTNEDAIAYRLHPADSNLLLCALADGQGGRAGGGAAARLAVSSVVDAACLAPPKALLSPSTWFDLCEVADRAVAAEQDAGFSTLVALAVTGEWVVGASCGDSAAVLLCDRANIVLTDRQRKNPPVGSGAAQFEPFSSALDGWWRMMIMSDGVWKHAGWDRVIEFGRRPGRDHSHGREVIEALRQEVMARSGGLLPDDFSIIVIDP